MNASSPSRAPAIAAATSLVVLAAMLANAPAAAVACEWEGALRQRHDVRSMAEAVASVARDLLAHQPAPVAVTGAGSVLEAPATPAEPALPATDSAPRLSDRLLEQLIDLPPPTC